MPPPLLFDFSAIDTAATVADRDAIYSLLPQRFEFEQLDRICYLDLDQGLGVSVREVREEDWWVRGHVPGMPIFPGALMLEAAAQTTAYIGRRIRDYEGFIAFGGVESCKFRGAVYPPATLYFLCRILENRSRRIKSEVQGVLNGQMVFEVCISGLGMAQKGN